MQHVSWRFKGLTTIFELLKHCNFFLKALPLLLFNQLNHQNMIGPFQSLGCWTQPLTPDPIGRWGKGGRLLARPRGRGRVWVEPPPHQRCRLPACPPWARGSGPAVRRAGGGGEGAGGGGGQVGAGAGQPPPVWRGSPAIGEPHEDALRLHGNSLDGGVSVCCMKCEMSINSLNPCDPPLLGSWVGYYLIWLVVWAQIKVLGVTKCIICVKCYVSGAVCVHSRRVMKHLFTFGGGATNAFVWFFSNYKILTNLKFKL